MDESNFRNFVAIQENEPLFNSRGSVIKPNVAPEDNGGMDIGFGHKITKEEQASGQIYSIRYSDGITREQALVILENDIRNHYNRARAFVGITKFDQLPPAAQQILTDFSFTGALKGFPKFILSIFDKNIAGVLKEYKRYFTSGGQKKPLKKRNKFTLDLIVELIYEGYFD